MSPLQWYPLCAICKQFVPLEVSKVDECGLAVHEECYVAKLRRTPTGQGVGPTKTLARSAYTAARFAPVWQTRNFGKQIGRS